MDSLTVNPKKRVFLKSLFIILFVIGSLGLLLIKWYKLNVVILILWPVIVLIFYALFLFRYAEIDTLGQGGDNLYYLGFLFTLVSLSTALAQFYFKKHNSDYIISSFGFSLSSTIVGITLRIFYNNFRNDPLEVEQVSYEDLSTASRKLKNELDRSTKIFEIFHTTLEQQLTIFKTSIEQKITEHAENTLEIAKENINKIVLSANKKIDQLTEKMKNSSDEVSSEIDMQLAQYTRNAKKLVGKTNTALESMEKFISKLDAINVPRDIIDKKFALLFAKIEENYEAYREYLKEDKELIQKKKKIASDSLKMINILNQKAKDIEKVMSQLEKLAETIQKSGVIFNDFNDNSKKSIESLSQFHTHNEEILYRLLEQSKSKTKEINEVHKEFIQQFKSMQEKLNKSCIENAESFKSSFKYLETSVNNEITNFVTTNKDVTKEFENYNENLKMAIRNSKSSIIKVNEVLASMLDIIAEKLMKNQNVK